MKRFKIIGTGRALPQKILTNEDLEGMVDTSDEWITTRTGIKTRHIADENTASSDLVVEAAKNAIDMAQIDKNEIECIVIGTITPDNIFPSTGCHVQSKLGLKNIPAFDMTAACSSFLYALNVAADMISSKTFKTVLVAGVDVLSKITDWKDRNTCVLFGDGAGAAILRATDEDSGLLSWDWGTDGSLGELLILPAGGSAMPASEQTVKERQHYIKMNGNEVFKHAVRRMGNSAKKVIKDAGISKDDISLFIPHQANMRIIDVTGKKAGIPIEKTYITIDKFANMSSATIPVALDCANREGKIKSGDNILFAAFGGGFTWAASVLKW